MSNPFGDNDDDDGENVLEGFLCPICKDDLKSPDRLTAHFDSVHATDEDQDILKSFKDIFVSAKKKIRQFDEAISTNASGENAFRSSPRKFNVTAPIYPQNVGVDCSHMSYFRAIRAPRLERYATETNKLVIRLHKLLTDLPSDPVQRKQHERNIVPWLDGESVKLCPSCVKRFYLTRRQHHCRLCGTIMCHDCSMFLSFDDASSIVKPSISPTGNGPEIAQWNNSRKEDGLRVCEHCLHLLSNRREMQESRTHRPPITAYYDKIQQLKKDILPDTKMYTKIVDRLNDGDSIYTLADAGALRGKIGRTAESIDSYSKAILSLQYEHGSREAQLKEAVRLACIKYIKEELLELSALPLESTILQLQMKRKQQTEMRIERERRLALEAIERYELTGGGEQMPISSTQLDKFASGAAVKTLDNWTGCQADTSNSINDPLVEQINIIKGYIKQARDALRFEEVETLELNLQELQQEFYKRQQQQRRQSDRRDH